MSTSERVYEYSHVFLDEVMPIYPGPGEYVYVERLEDGVLVHFTSVGVDPDQVTGYLAELYDEAEESDPEFDGILLFTVDGDGVAHLA
jgi:hypothetical protein